MSDKLCRRDARECEEMEAERDALRARVAELEADAMRWRYFVRHNTFWRASQCIQYGGEVHALRPGGPGDYELKKLSFDADIDKARAALAGRED